MKTAYVLVEWTEGTAYVVLGVYSSSERAEKERAKAHADGNPAMAESDVEVMEFEVDE